MRRRTGDRARGLAVVAVVALGLAAGCGSSDDQAITSLGDEELRAGTAKGEEVLARVRVDLPHPVTLQALAAEVARLLGEHTELDVPARALTWQTTCRMALDRGLDSPEAVASTLVDHAAEFGIAIEDDGAGDLAEVIVEAYRQKPDDTTQSCTVADLAL